MNITPRLILDTINTIAGAEIGKYTLQDGTQSPAIGILGLRDQRVHTTEGCEVLISPIANGNYTYEGGTHSYERGSFEIRIIQHRASTYYISRLVERAVSFTHFGRIEWHLPDGVQTVPYAVVHIGFPSLHLTNSEVYDAKCSFTASCPT